MRGSAGSPKRSASRTAIGRAPIVKMSRRMPPTPVAAPWYGSTALGMVVRLDLERDRQPVADRDHAGVLARPGDDALARRSAASRSSGFELLYEQCSLHITLNIASSRSFGVAAQPVADRVELVVGEAEPRWSGTSAAAASGQRAHRALTVDDGVRLARRAARRRSRRASG